MEKETSRKINKQVANPNGKQYKKVPKYAILLDKWNQRKLYFTAKLDSVEDKDVPVYLLLSSYDDLQEAIEGVRRMI